MILFARSNEVCSVVGGPAATRLLAANQKSLQARFAALYPVLAQKYGIEPAGAHEVRRRSAAAAVGE